MSAGVIGVTSSEEEEKKMKRKLTNRESARRSRERKQKDTKDLINENASMKSTSEKYRQKIVNMEKDLSETKNKLVRYEKAELEDQLECFKKKIDNYGVQPASFNHLGFSEPQMLLNSSQFEDSFNYQLPVTVTSSEPAAASSEYLFQNPSQFQEPLNYQLPVADASSEFIMFENPFQFHESFNYQLPFDATSSGSMFPF